MSDTRRYTMTSLLLRLKEIAQKHPIFVILSIAFLLRLTVALVISDNSFGKEHFFYFEMPNSWLDNSEYQNNHTYTEPQGISLFYLSLNYAWLAIMKFIGVKNIVWLTFLSRLLHAFISLFVISFGYRITELLSNKRTGIMVACALAFFWFMPFVSAYTTPAFVCTIFLMYATLVILRQEINRYESKSVNVHRTSFIIAGFFLGLGFSTYYQCLPYILGIFIALMLVKNVKNALVTLLGFLISTSIVLVIPDLLVWGKAFAELQAFIASAPEFMFFETPHLIILATDLLFIILSTIPPLNIMLLCGFFNNCRKRFLLFFPSTLVILYYIFTDSSIWVLSPIFPIYLALGIAGWKEIVGHSSFWQNHITLHKTLIGISIFLNIALLIYVMIMI